MLSSRPPALLQCRTLWVQIKWWSPWISFETLSVKLSVQKPLHVCQVLTSRNNGCQKTDNEIISLGLVGYRRKWFELVMEWLVEMWWLWLQVWESCDLTVGKDLIVLMIFWFKIINSLRSGLAVKQSFSTAKYIPGKFSDNLDRHICRALLKKKPHYWMVFNTLNYFTYQINQFHSF